MKELTAALTVSLCSAYAVLNMKKSRFLNSEIATSQTRDGQEKLFLIHPKNYTISYDNLSNIFLVSKATILICTRGKREIKKISSPAKNDFPFC